MTAKDHRASDAEDPGDGEAVSFEPGDTLGPYVIVRFIARGGMGMVWAARLTGAGGFNRLYALKTMLPAYSRDSEYVKVFLDEANVAAALHHPHVCQVLDFGCDKQVLYIAMEWVVGASLGALIQAHPNRCLPLGVAARVVADACAGLDAVHEAKDLQGRALNIIHRDVTPHNILLTTEGHAKLADFGVARFNQQTHKKTATGIVKGKAHYMAPEQLLSHKLDQRSDLFSLGCVLYEVSVGRRPFAGKDLAATMRQIVKGSPRAPSDDVPDFPRTLEAIIVRATAKAPADRFESARAMRIALEDWLVAEAPGVTHINVAAELRAHLRESIDRLRTELRTQGTGVGPSLTTGAPTPDEGVASIAGPHQTASPRAAQTGSVARVPRADLLVGPEPADATMPTMPAIANPLVPIYESLAPGPSSSSGAQPRALDASGTSSKRASWVLATVVAIAVVLVVLALQR